MRPAANWSPPSLCNDPGLFGLAETFGQRVQPGLIDAGDSGIRRRIILTGGLAYSKYVAAYITKKVSFIAPVEVMAGEFELEALAAGACRVLDGEEKAKDFSKLLEKA